MSCISRKVASTGEFCVSVPDSSSFAMMATTATSAITTLLLNFPGSSLTRVTNDVMLHRDADRITGGCGGGGEGIVYYCDFVAPSKTSPATDAAAATAAANAASSLAAKDAAGSESQDVNPSAMAAAFALASRAAMVHLGHLSCTVGVASGKAVFCPAGGDLQRSEWTVVGEAVQRAQRLAVFGEAEVLCDLSVARACAGWPIDFDPVPHAAGDDILRVRNLVAGSLDLILGRSGGASRSRWSRRADECAWSVVAGAGAFTGSKALGKLELAERGGATADGVGPGPCVLMPAGTLAALGSRRANETDAAANRARLAEETRASGNATGASGTAT